MSFPIRSLAVFILVSGVTVARAQDAEKITYQDHILPIFKAKCGSCHGADSAKGGLVIDSYTALMQGGASGEVVVGGDVDASRLWALVAHTEQPFMPPKEEKLPEPQLALIKKWIDTGALDTKTSVAKVKKKSNLTLGTVVIGAKPEGPPPMPENLSTEPLITSARGNIITALAASPWAPLVAVAGHKQVLLYDTKELRLAAVLPFPEGQAHVLKFSRNGSLLLAGGGRAGQSGRVIVWDVRTGSRVFEIGAEYDSVLAADISADHSQIALGGPRKMVRVYSTKDGELMYEIKKHTDWITSLEFSPDGVLLATGDRSNGLFVWEAFTGREFYVLNGHQGAVSGISWRLDSNIVASCSEDSTIKLWEMTNGGQVKNWGAHGGGAAAVQFTRDGRLLSTGRDRVTKLFDQNGQVLKSFPAHNDLGLEVAFCSETDRAFAGDWTGVVRAWQAADAAELPSLASNPAKIVDRQAVAIKVAEVSQAAAADALARFTALDNAEKALKTAAETAQKQATDAQAAAVAAEAAKVAAEKAQTDTAAAATAAQTALATAKTALEAATTAKAAADKAVADSNDATKPAAEKAQTEAAAALKTATDAATAAQAASDKAAADAEAAKKAAADAVAKLKTAVDAAAAAKTAAEKAVAAAQPTPERTKALTDADTVAKAAAAKAAADKAVIEILEKEKGRATAAVPAPAAPPAQ